MTCSEVSVSRNCRRVGLLIGAFLVAVRVAAAQPDPDFDRRPTSDWPTGSPDGTRLVFVSDATGTKNIWVANQDGSNPRPVMNWGGSAQVDPAWSPDGTTITFSSNRGGREFNIWTIRPDGSAARQLTVDDGDNRQPRYSPDGTLILFTSNRNGRRELWTMQSDGSEPDEILSPRMRVSDPAWSPDGTGIVFVGCSPSNTAPLRMACNLFTLVSDDDEVTRITSGDVMDWNPTWGPQGIVFASDREGIQGLWITQPDGQALREFTHPPGGTGDLHPQWDLRGSQVVFGRAGQGADQAGMSIWSADAAGNERRLTNVKGFTYDGDVNVNGTVNCEDLAMFGRHSGGERDKRSLIPEPISTPTASLMCEILRRHRRSYPAGRFVDNG